MSRVDFYHLQKQSLDDVLPTLLSKAYAVGKNIVVKVGKNEQTEVINSYLWTYRDDSFLPHGSKKDGFATEQPIWLTEEDDNPNKAEFLFLIGGATVQPEMLTGYERVFNIFDGNSEESLMQARSFWKDCKEGGFEVFYWQQDNSGKWEQKG